MKRALIVAFIVVALLLAVIQLFGGTVSDRFVDANQDVTNNVVFGDRPGRDKFREANDDMSTTMRFDSRPSPQRDYSQHAEAIAARAARGGAPLVHIERKPVPVDPYQPTRLALDPPAQAAANHSFVSAQSQPKSTFSIDVNTASYTASRDAIMNGNLPHPTSVRPEEFLNYFNYEYEAPAAGEDFSIQLDMVPSYFGSSPETPRHLMRVGIRGADIAVEDMNPSNLVFLVDVSGSMGMDIRLEAAKIAMRTLLNSLRPDDTVAIQTYASGTTTALEPTPVADRTKILQAIDGLVARGATRGDAAIIRAYELAKKSYINEGNNRVIIFSDGDFNVGPPGEDLAELIRSYRDDHITVTTVAMGLGSKDHTMERLARDTNGNYFYIDSQQEAVRIFEEQVVGTLQVLAADVKIQVEFNPEHVRSYRLIGYEKRAMANEDFDNDEVDAAELGPGHTVTAFYEVELTDQAPD